MLLLAKLLPIFVYFFIGVMLRKSQIAGAPQGVFMTKMVFYITMPALILLTVSNTPMTGERWVLPLANLFVDLACFAIAWAYARWRGITGIKAGCLVIGSSLVNSVFMFPFILAFFGEAGVAEGLLFDFGNVIALATVVYGAAFRYSGQTIDTVQTIVKVLSSPVVFALILAIVVSVAGWQIPAVVVNVLRPLGNMTTPILLIGLGLMFAIKPEHYSLLPVGVVIRYVGGFVSAVFIAKVLGFSGDTFAIVVLMGTAPIGFMSVTLASIAKLDVEFATSMGSASVVLGLVVIPLLVWGLGVV